MRILDKNIYIFKNNKQKTVIMSSTKLIISLQYNQKAKNIFLMYIIKYLKVFCKNFEH